MKIRNLFLINNLKKNYIKIAISLTKIYKYIIVNNIY